MRFEVQDALRNQELSFTSLCGCVCVFFAHQERHNLECTDYKLYMSMRQDSLLFVRPLFNWRDFLEGEMSHNLSEVRANVEIPISLAVLPCMTNITRSLLWSWLKKTSQALKEKSLSRRNVSRGEWYLSLVWGKCAFRLFNFHSNEGGKVGNFEKRYTEWPNNTQELLTSERCQICFKDMIAPQNVKN